MPLAEANQNLSDTDLVTPRTAVRLPGIPGEVFWHAEIDTINERLRILKIEFPNGAVDTIDFGGKTEVVVTRIIDDQPIKLSPSMTRQALAHARIISGLHLQLAVEKVVGNGR